MGTPVGPSNGSSRTSRRSQFEIWAQVLEACTSAGRTQTSLLHLLRLKTAAIKEVLEFLVGGELIAKIQNSNGDSSLFKTTPRGEEALLAYYKLLRDYFAK